MPQTRTTTTLDTDHRRHGGVARWPLERVLFALAGAVTLLSVVLTAAVSPWFLLLAAFVGINQWLYVVIGNCPASLVLRRLGFAESCSR